MKNEKKQLNIKNIGLILSIVGLLLIVISFIYAMTCTNIFKSKENEGDIESDVIEFNGIYENDGIIVKIYDIPNLEIDGYSYEYIDNINYNIGNMIIGFAQLHDNTATSDGVESLIEFEFTNKGLDLKADDNTLKKFEGSIKNGTYKKVKEYKDEDFYSDYIGNIKFFESKYNGEYKMGESKLFAFQTNEDEIKVYVFSDPKSSIVLYGLVFNIQPDGSLKESIVFGNEDPTATIKFEDNKYIFTSKSSDEISGTYEKVGSLSLKNANSLY